MDGVDQKFYYIYFVRKIFFFLLFPILVYSSDNLTKGTPKIVGDWNVGKTLSVDISDLTDADGIGQFEYQWLRDEEEIAGATTSTYYLLLSDLEKSISVRLNHTDVLGNVDTLYTPLFGAWGEYQYLSDEIKITQAAVVRITASTAVMISPTHAITAAHSPLDENNEITPNLTVQNIFGEIRDIINVKYDSIADFAIVELESAFQNSYAVEIAPNKPSAGDAAFAVGNPKDVAWGGVGWAVSFGFARDIEHTRDAEYEDIYNLFDIQIMGGFSGGGIFNDKGQLQGIISGQTTEHSDGSFRPENTNTGTFFSEDFDLLDGPWKSLDRMQIIAIGLDFINEFLALHQVTNIKNTDNIVLPKNKKDYHYNSLTDEEESYLESIAGPLRKSTVAYSIDKINPYTLPNGSGVIIDDRIVATNSHVVEGKEYFDLTLYDGTVISGAVLDHHGEEDLSLILLDTPIPNYIIPVPIAESRPVLGDLGFLIGHPGDLWSSHGAWQVSGAVSGYARHEIDDRGNILLDGGGSSGMSGGPIFNSSGELVGINYATGSRLYTLLEDYQDPHSTYYNPVVAPGVMQLSGVDVSPIRDLIDENSIYFSNHTSPSSAFEIKYFNSNSGNVYSAEKSFNNINQSIIIKEVVDYSFSEVKNVSIPIDNNIKWTLVDFINYDNGYILVNTFLENYSVGVQVSKLNSSFELDNSFGSGGHLSQLFTNNIVQKIIKSTIFDNKLYLLIQNANDQQISYSVYTLDLSNLESFVSLFESTAEFATSSNYFSKDFIVNSNGIFVGGTTDDSDPNVGFGKRTYDHFVSHYSINGSINTNFADNGVFQKNFGDTDKATALAIQNDGKILIAGMNWLDLAPDAVATRLNTDGTVDTSFGDNGTTPVARFLTSQNHLSMRDLGNEGATDIFIDESGNIFIAGRRYVGEIVPSGMLMANNGSYQGVIWKYDSSGNIVEDFGTYEYTNGTLEGLKIIKLMGNSKVKKLLNVNNQLLAFIATRDNITKNTSNKVFLIDDVTGEAEVFATNEPVIYVKNPLVVYEDSPLENIEITYWNPGGGDVNYSFSNPNLGSITDNGDKTFNYHPNLNENGSDSLVITFNDGGTIINKKINIMVKRQDDLPSISPSNELTIEEDTISPILTIEDVDSPLISYELGYPEKGSLKDNGDFTFTYTPNSNVNGEDNFEVSVVSMDKTYEHEERSSTIQVKITINAVNDPPVSEDVTSSTYEDNLVEITLKGTDEVENDPLTYSVVEGPTNGSVSIDGDKATYSPNLNFNGEDSFTYKANDGTDDSNTATVSITVGDPLAIEYKTFINKIYPNPTDNEFIVELKDNSKVIKVEFVDFSGKIIIPNKVELNNSSIRINVSNIIEGIYLLYITMDKEVNKVKVVIER